MAADREMAFKFNAQLASGFNANMGKFWGALTKSDKHLHKIARAQHAVGKSAHGMRNSLKGLAGLAAGYLTIRGLTSAYQSVTKAANEQIRAETRLEALMGNVKGTRKEDIEGIKKQAAALQRVTTIGDEVSIAGASQLATFQLQGKYINQLLPSLQDLAVGTHGVRVSQEQMQQSANQLGKVFTGQLGALTKAGISFDKQQEKLLKHGTQAQKVATMVKVIGQNYGDLARKMRQTPEGREIALLNTWGDIQEKVGLFLLPIREKLVKYLDNNLPRIEKTFMRMLKGVENWFKKNKPTFEKFGQALLKAWKGAQPTIKWFNEKGLPKLLDMLGKVLLHAANFSNWVIDNWSKIKPIVATIGTAMVALRLGSFAMDAADAAGGLFKVFNYLRKIKGIGPITLAITLAVVVGEIIANQIQKGIIDSYGKADAGLANAAKMEQQMKDRLAAGYKATGANRQQVRAAMRAANPKLGATITPAQELAYLKSKYGYADKPLVTVSPAKQAGIARQYSRQMENQQRQLDALKSHPGYGSTNITGMLAQPFARGGLVTRPTLAMVGEAGPELILPMNRGGLGSITFAPVININGGAGVRGQVEAGLHAGLDEFERKLRAVMRRERRTAYAG